jgi:hypothetical protein
MRAQEFLPEITFNSTGKSATTRYDFDEFINNAEFTGKIIGNYELWIGRYGTGEALLVKSDDEIDPGFLGAMYLLKSGDEKYYHTEIMFDPEIQGKGLAVPMYLYVLQDMGLTIMSDRTQTPGGAAIWKKLAERPDVNVYIYNTSDNSFHGEYDPRDSGRVYGPEDWRHKIRLVATTDTVTSIDEAWSKKYKDSINCSNPKGFSQRAHCAGRKKKANESEFITEAYSLELLKKTPAVSLYGILDNGKEVGRAFRTTDGTVKLQLVGHPVITVKAASVLDAVNHYAQQIEFAAQSQNVEENFHDGKKKGKSRPGRVKRAGASCKGSVTDLRAKAKKYSGERGKMYHWCANMKAGKKKKK